MSIFQAVVLAIVEGITEFLPISSTGHLIITSSLLGIAEEDFTKTFTVSIQLGAILSVVVLYFKRFLQSFKFYTILFVAFLPAMAAGFLFGDFIDALLENVLVVAITLVLGGIVLLFIDKWFPEDASTQDTIQFKDALIIGLYQCIALLPGVSRSGATIFGGLSRKFSRRTAAEFSFFLAVPTMFAATVYTLFLKENEAGEKAYTLLFNAPENMTAFIVGNIVAFVIAMLAMRSFVSYLTRHGFKLFGWYRIIIGTLILLLLAMDVNLQVV